MFYSFQAKTLLYVIQTTEGRKNLVYIHFTLSRFFANALNDKCFRIFSSPKLVQNLKRCENSLHSLHDAYNYLIINTSPCNDKKNRLSLMSLEWLKWHQWHVKNKHMSLGSIDIQRIKIPVQWVTCVFTLKSILSSSKHEESRKHPHFMPPRPFLPMVIRMTNCLNCLHAFAKF